MNIQRAPVVYVVQTPNNASLDYSSATTYGRLQFLIEDPLFQPSVRPGVARRIMEDRLKDYDPDLDYVTAIGGDPSGLLLLGLILGEWMPGKPIRYLRWNRGAPPVEIDSRRGGLVGATRISGYVPVLMSGRPVR